MTHRVVVSGACGRMGQEVVRWIMRQDDMQLCGAVEKGVSIGADIGRVLGSSDSGIEVSDNLPAVLETSKPDSLVDFTRGSEAPRNILEALSRNIPCITGTTGISEEALEEIRLKALSTDSPVLIAPNFSLGAVLMMRFSAIAARYYSFGEIIELHHDKKKDAPSGTALRTAELMTQGEKEFRCCEVSEEKIAHTRGGEHKGIHIHSIRLPGLLAHQEVLFGGEGEILTIRHDSTARSSFMPGVMLAIRKIRTLNGLVIGLEHIMDL